jgi:hypothetical protein
MRSRIVMLALAYGAGLWVGLVFMVPARVILPLLAAATFGLLWTRTWTLIAAVLSISLATGAARATQQASSCGRIWSPGVRSVLLRLHDRPGTRGTASASVLHSREGCRGTIRLRVNSDSLRGGVRVIAFGQYRGGGVLSVSWIRELQGGRSLLYALRHAMGRRVRTLYGGST